VTVNTGVFKVDTSSPIRTDNNLELWFDNISSSIHVQHNEIADLVIPPVRACPNLNTSLQVVRSAQEIAAQICQITRGCVVQANNE
jgi:hypothetical protein